MNEKQYWSLEIPDNLLSSQFKSTHTNQNFEPQNHPFYLTLSIGTKCSQVKPFRAHTLQCNPFIVTKSCKQTV